MKRCQGKKDKIINSSDGRSYYVNEETGEIQEILQDRSSTGRVRRWEEYKSSNLELVNIYNGIEGDKFERKAKRLFGCGYLLGFVPVLDDNGVLVSQRVAKTHSCHVRLCPLCAWRRSIKVQTHTMKILDYLEETKGYEYLLLTLTVPNVTADELSKALDDIFLAFNKLSKYKAFQQAVKGWYRGLEVTHNTNRYSKSFDTYHPHLHNILAVNKSYFKSKDYIKQADWLAMWQKATRNPNITQVDIRKIRPKNGFDNIRGAVCETAKYTVKSNDYITKDKELSKSAVITLDNALANRRLVAYGGVMKEAHSKLNLDDEIDGNLANTSGDVIGDGEELEMLYYCFNIGIGHYVRKYV